MGGLWPDLPALLAAARALNRADAVVVRITALEQDEEVPEDLDLVGSAFDRHDLLGYDVADYCLMSGLANCGYSPDEAASLAPAWVPLLNEWHLFGTPEDAAAYAEVTNQRVSEHAPFYAYGIYQPAPSRASDVYRNTSSAAISYPGTGSVPPDRINETSQVESGRG